MGGGASKVKKVVKDPVTANWQNQQLGDAYNVVRNRNDGRQAEQYSYTLDNRYDPVGQSVIYDLRNKTTEPIVRSLDHQFETKGSGLVPLNNFRVVTERIPHRFSTAPQLTFDESLYTLDRSLAGYQYLYRKTGPFDINSNMFGYTPQGEVRVWHNENFGKNYPTHEKRTLQSTRQDESFKYDGSQPSLQQIEMVRNIVNIVQDRNEQGQFPQDFRSRIRSNIGFHDARRVIQQQLARPERFTLNRVDLYRNLVRSRTHKTSTYVEPKRESHNHYLFHYDTPKEYFHPSMTYETRKY